MPGILPHLIDFFDPDHDGKITLTETYDGLRRLDIGRLSAVGIAATINFGLAAIARDNPFALDLGKMARARHPGDSGVVDESGDLLSERLERLFAAHARTYPDALTASELVALARDDLRSRGRIFTLPRDVVAIIGEWGLLWWVGGEERHGQRVLTRARVRDFYTDAALFSRIAEENEARRAERSHTPVGRLINILHGWIF
jgi:hypothetical protein